MAQKASARLDDDDDADGPPNGRPFTPPTGRTELPTADRSGMLRARRQRFPRVVQFRAASERINLQAPPLCGLSLPPLVSIAALLHSRLCSPYAAAADRIDSAPPVSSHTCRRAVRTGGEKSIDRH